MPGLDDRLERALRGAAVLPERDADAVTAAVAVKHRRRQIRRRAVASLAVAAVVVTALATTAVVVTRDPADDGANVVAGPTTTTTTTTEVPPPSAPSTLSPGQAPENPEDARDAIAAALAEGLPAESLPPGATTIQTNVTFISPTEAVVDVLPVYRGLRVQLVDDAWTLSAATTCRVRPDACTPSPPEVRVAPGKARFGLKAYGWSPATAEPIALAPDPGYVAGPLLSSGDAVVTTAHDRDGSTFTAFPSHLISITPSVNAIVQVAEIEGQVLSLADGEGALWAVTRDERVDTDLVEYRVKRIQAANSPPDTMPVPPGRIPAGDIVAGAGGVWVPVRDGVLIYNPATGALEHEIDLPIQDRRGIALVGDAVYVTDGAAVRTLDSEGMLGAPTETGADRLTDLAAAGDAVWALSASGDVLTLDVDTAQVSGVAGVPPGMQELDLHSDGTRAWVSGQADLAPQGEVPAESLAVEPVAVLLDNTGIAATLVVAGATDVGMTFAEDGQLVLTSGGTAYRVTLPE